MQTPKYINFFLLTPIYNFRIRLVIIQHIPPLAKQFGQAFVSERLAPLCVRLLEDDISKIRQAAASNLAVSHVRPLPDKFYVSVVRVNLTQLVYNDSF